MKVNLWVFVIYVGMAIFTFGYAADGFRTECVEDARYQIGGRLCATDAAVAALLVSIFWPLYWSWEVQS